MYHTTDKMRKDTMLTCIKSSGRNYELKIYGEENEAVDAHYGFRGLHFLSKMCNGFFLE